MADNITKLNLSITVDDGFQRVPIYNKFNEEIGVFYFNPTDVNIIERYNNLAETFDSITEPLQAVQNGENGDIDSDDNRNIEALHEATERLYAAVNELFGGNMAEAFFGRVNPFSPVNGTFYCEQALQSVGQFISEQFDAETKKFSERVKKYTNRAQRRANK